MSNIEDRIVSMQFDNEQFQRRLADTIQSLDNLTKALEFTDAQNTFADIGTAADNVDLSSIAEGVDNISSKFSALGAIAFTALQGITNSVLNFVRNTGQDILGPILTGGKTRAGNIEQAKFQFEGLGIDIDAAMTSALDAVRGTAFGLDEAAKAAAQFGASGITAGDDMTSALRGIAGSAAMTGSSFSEIADIFTGIAGVGKLTNQDLLQFGTRGLNAAATLAQQLGKTEAQIHEMARNGDIDFKTFAKAMDDAFGAHATEANKTYAGSLANLHAAMSRLGASFFGPQQQQQRDLFNALTPVIDEVNKALQPLIQQFLEIRRIGIDKIIGFLQNLNLDNLFAAIPNFAESLRDVFTMIGRFTSVIKEAFKEVFPPLATNALRDFSFAFLTLIGHLREGTQNLDKLKSIFKGFFAILDIGLMIVKGVAGVFVDIFRAIFPATGALLGVGASVGDMVFKFDQALKQGTKLQDFFQHISTYAATAITFLKELATKVTDFFTATSDTKFVGGGFDKIEGTTSRVQQRIEQLIGLPKKVSEVWSRLEDRFSGVFTVLDKVFDYMVNWFKELGSKLAAAFGPGDFDSTVDVINVGLLGGLALMFKKFLDGGVAEIISGGLIGKIKNAIDELTGTLQAMQTNLKAEALLKIAEAIAILVASLVVLSLIDSKALTRALVALSVGFGQLIAAMTLLDRIDFGTSAFKLNGLAAGMILIASAAVILAAAIRILSSLDIGSLAKGLVGVGVGLGILVVSMNLLSADNAGMINAGIAMIAISTALILLSKAVASFASISWLDMAKGLVGVAVGLGLLTLAMNNMPPSSILSGLGFIEVAAGLLILSEAVKSFANISWQDLVKGLVGIGAGLLIISQVMGLMPIDLPITAAGVLILSGAMLVLAKAVALMGGTDIGSLAKGIGAFAAMLLILAVGVNAMNGAAAGAATLIVVAAAMVILTKVLKDMSGIDFGDLLHGLIVMTATIGTLALVSVVIEPLVPSMLALAIAIGAVGTAFILFGIGATLVAKALQTLATSGVAGVKAIVEGLKILTTAIPDIGRAAAQAILNIAEDFLNAAPLLIRLATAVLEQLLETVIKLTPKIGEAFVVIILTALKAIRDTFPSWVQTGFDLLISLLQGIRDNIGQVVASATEMIIAFAQSLIVNMPVLVAAAAQLIISFLGEVANHAQELAAAGLNLLVQLLQGIADNIGLVLNSVGNIVTNFITGLGSQVDKIIAAGADVIVNFVTGLGQNGEKIVEGATNAIIKFAEALANNSLKIINAAGDILVDFLHGIAEAIRTHSDELRKAGIDIAGAILDGMTFGLAGKAGDVISGAKDLGGSAVDGVKGILHIDSPSKVFIKIGEFIAEGLAIGMTNNDSAKNASADMADKVVSAFQETIAKIPDSIGTMDNFNPVITPVLDLTKVEEASNNLDKLMAVSAITPDVSFSKARIIATTADFGKTSDTTPVNAGPTEVKFEQNNYSPTALSTNDIYRNTKSQIALAKEELGIS